MRIFMYKLMNNMLLAALDYLIIRNNDIHQYNTRHVTNYMVTCKSLVNQLYIVVVLEVFRYGMLCQKFWE